MAITIALDCMGGDHGAHVTVPAALDFIDRVEDAQVVLVGIPETIETELKRRRAKTGDRIRIEAATEVVAMDEAPALALRGKRDSSMRLAVDPVKREQAERCVSAREPTRLMAAGRSV